MRRPAWRSLVRHCNCKPECGLNSTGRTTDHMGVSVLVSRTSDGDELYGWGRGISSTPKRIAGGVKMAVSFAYGANMFYQDTGTLYTAYVTSTLTLQAKRCPMGVVILFPWVLLPGINSSGQPPPYGLPGMSCRCHP